MTPIDPESCKNVSEKSKSKVLLQAYAVAAEGHDLDHFKTLLADHQRALDQEIEEQEAKAAAKAEKDAKKNKRKSMDIVDEDAEDVEMGDADDAKKSKGSTKKRKKDTKAEDEEKVRVLSVVFLEPSLHVLFFSIARKDAQDRHQVEADDTQDTRQRGRQKDSWQQQVQADCEQQEGQGRQRRGRRSSCRVKTAREAD